MKKSCPDDNDKYISFDGKKFPSRELCFQYSLSINGKDFTKLINFSIFKDSVLSDFIGEIASNEIDVLFSFTLSRPEDIDILKKIMSSLTNYSEKNIYYKAKFAKGNYIGCYKACYDSDGPDTISVEAFNVDRLKKIASHLEILTSTLYLKKIDNI